VGARWQPGAFTEPIVRHARWPRADRARPLNPTSRDQ
jgi:hypothetical protein